MSNVFSKSLESCLLTAKWSDINITIEDPRDVGSYPLLLTVITGVRRTNGCWDGADSSKTWIRNIRAICVRRTVRTGTFQLFETVPAAGLAATGLATVLATGPGYYGDVRFDTTP